MRMVVILNENDRMINELTWSSAFSFV